MKKRINSLLTILIFAQGLTAQQKNMDYYISTALQNSPLLIDYRNQIQSGLIDSMRIHAGQGIQVNATSNNSYSPVFNGWGHDEAITNGANVTALVTASKDIIGKRNINNQYLSVRLQNLSILNTSKVSEQDLRKSVMEQYINTFGLWQQYQFNNDVLTLLQKEEKILKILSEQGAYKQTDYLTFLVNMQQQQWQMTQIRNQYRDNFATLNYLCGITDTSWTQISEPNLELADLPEVKTTVFYQQFIIDSLKLNTDDKQVDFSYRPKLDIFGNAGYNSSLVSAPAKNFGTTIGLNLSVPIYDGHQRKMQHNKVAIAEQTSHTYRNFFVKQHSQQINRLLQQLKANKQVALQTSQQIVFAQALMDANHKLLEKGNASVLDYIIAINNYLNVKNALVQNSIEKYLIINQINYWNKK